MERLERLSTKSAPVALCVLSCNGIDTSKEFLTHLVNQTDDEDYDLIWIDNGSKDGTKKLLTEHWDSHSNATIIFNKENSGVIGGRNIGFEEFLNGNCDSEYLMFLDNDQFVRRDWLQQHRNVIDHGYDLIGVESWQMSKRFMPNQKNYRLTDWFSYVGCGGMMIRREAVENIGMFDEQFNPCYFEDPDYCYDKETYLLTKDGLKPFPEVSMDDDVLTLTDDGVQEYRKPERVIKKFEEKLLHFRNQQIDICCTPDQYLLVGYKRNPWREADKGKYIKPDFIKAKDIAEKLNPRQCKYFIEKASGNWNAHNNNTIDINGEIYDSLHFARFMGWYLSEGYVYDEKKRKERRGYEVRIGQFKEANFDKISESISGLGYVPNKRKDGYSFSSSPGFYKYLQNFGLSDSKYVPDEVRFGSLEMISEFVNSYCLGDGTIKPSGGFSLYTSSWKMKNGLVDLLVKMGRAFSFSPQGGGNVEFKNGIYNCKECWHIQSYSKTWANLPVPVSVDYNDYVYDVTVPNHRIYVVRNGKGCWSSNCFRAHENGFKIGWNWKSRTIHMPHQTLGKVKDKTKFFTKSLMKFRSKWKGTLPPMMIQTDIPAFK